MGILLSALALLGLGGCTNEPEAIDGGTTTVIDADAPKVIESKEITAFSVNFFLWNRWRGEDEHFFRFEVKEDASGTLTASETRSGVSHPADEALLSALQEIIDEYELVKENGLYEVTAGLPPEYQERTLRVEYASGESLCFTTNNEPNAAWAERVYEVFADWFAANGQDALRPAKESTLVTRLDLRMKEDGVWTEYVGINVPQEDSIDGQTYLLMQDLYDETAQEHLAENFILFPQDYYEEMTRILAGHDAVLKYDFSREGHGAGYFGFCGKTEADGEEDAETLYLDLYVEYESGRRMNIETRKASEIEGAQPLIRDMLAYFEPLFAQ